MGGRACLCGMVNCKRHGRRPSRSTGAYGADHQERRRRMLAGIKAGTIPAICAFCGGGPCLGPEWAWEADHRIPVARGTDGQVRPAHRVCNRRAGAELGIQLRKERVERRAHLRIVETYELLDRSRGA